MILIFENTDDNTISSYTLHGLKVFKDQRTIICNLVNGNKLTFTFKEDKDVEDIIEHYRKTAICLIDKEKYVIKYEISGVRIF